MDIDYQYPVRFQNEARLDIFGRPPGFYRGPWNHAMQLRERRLRPDIAWRASLLPNQLIGPIVFH